VLVTEADSVKDCWCFQEDPTLERHFKGHRDTVTSVDFSPNTKQLGVIYYHVLYLFMFTAICAFIFSL